MMKLKVGTTAWISYFLQLSGLDTNIVKRKFREAKDILSKYNLTMKIY